MAKLTLNDIESLANTASAKQALNENFAEIEAFADDTLSRSGVLPNQMEADIDLNSNDLLNVGRIDAHEIYRDGVPLEQQVAYGDKKFLIRSGTGSQVDFALADHPGSLGNLEITISGVMQRPGIDYTFTDTLLSFTVAPPEGENNILIRYDEALPVGVLPASAIAFQADATGATLRSIEEKMRDWISVKDFGALGDGITDDTLAIQRAINWAETFSAGSGMAIYFPPGDYLYTQLRIEASGVRLVASETSVRLLKIGVLGDGVTFGDVPGRIFNVGISGFIFGQALADASSGAQLRFKNVGKMFIVGCQVMPFPHEPATGIHLTNCLPVTLDRITSSDCLGSGFLFEDCGDMYGTALHADANNGSGFEFNKVTGAYFTNCSAFGNAVSAWFFTDTFVGWVLASRTAFIFMANCIGDTSGGNNWSINNVVLSTFSGCWGATNLSPSIPDLSGFAISGTSQNLTFQGCHAHHNNGPGLIVGSTCTGIRVIGGGFEENGQNASSTNRAGVVHAGSGVVEMIRAQDTQSPGFKTQNYGLIVNPNGYMRIRDNQLTGNALGGVSPPGSGWADLEVSGNDTGDVDTAASDITCVLPGLGERYQITGTADIYDFSPKWKGRKISLRFASTARLVGGASMFLSSANLTPGANGTAVLEHDGTAWLLQTVSVNDNA